jgi:hypothetical protein
VSDYRLEVRIRTPDGYEWREINTLEEIVATSYRLGRVWPLRHSLHRMVDHILDAVFREDPKNGTAV